MKAMCFEPLLLVQILPAARRGEHCQTLEDMIGPVPERKKPRRMGLLQKPKPKVVISGVAQPLIGLVKGNRVPMFAFPCTFGQKGYDHPSRLTWNSSLL